MTLLKKKLVSLLIKNVEYKPFSLTFCRLFFSVGNFVVIIMTVKNPVANKINFLGTLETSQRAELQKCFMILRILASFLQRQMH